MDETTCRVPDCDRAIDHKRNRLCKMHQARWRRRGTTDLPAKTPPRPCAVQGCESAARSRSADLCSKHYHRKYRHGSVEKVATGAEVTVSHGRRYRVVYQPGHPVAGLRGMAYEHRVVLYDRIGLGPHGCHWCGVPVRWDAAKLDDDALQVDHLNSIGDDNRPANLVPACRPCNTRRAMQARHRALVDAGFWSENDTIARTGRGRARPVE